MDGSLLFSGSVLFTASRTWFLGLVSIWEEKQLPLGFEMLMNREIFRLRDFQVKVKCKNQIYFSPSPAFFYLT